MRADVSEVWRVDMLKSSSGKRFPPIFFLNESSVLVRAVSLLVPACLLPSPVGVWDERGALLVVLAPLTLPGCVPCEGRTPR